MRKRYKTRLVSSEIDEKFAKQHNILHVCGICDKIVGADKEVHEKHLETHQENFTHCRTCHVHLKVGEEREHKIKFHSNCNQIEFYLDSASIELKIPAGKGFSNFWGISLPPTCYTLRNFKKAISRNWRHHKTARTIGTFRVRESKFKWTCPLCSEEMSQLFFNESLTMRAYAMRHLEDFHRDEILLHMPSFFEIEWHFLNEDAMDFDLRSLMHISRKRIKIENRSLFTFYSVRLENLENGPKFLEFLKKHGNFEEENLRFCLFCCCLIPERTLIRHFATESHRFLKAVPESTVFIARERNPEEGKQGEQQEKEIVEDSQKYQFPQDLFLYSVVFKNLRSDVFRWRCCLCPKSHSLTFCTAIIMRMYALRHIEQYHKFLFTDEFLDFEWKSLKHEMRANFDIRNFLPMIYTVRGESTFNPSDPNDYVLPQQYYFIPKSCSRDSVICGFCYRSLERKEFIKHIVIHGFGEFSREPCELRPMESNETVKELMGQECYLDNGLVDEPVNILSIEGKRLKSKMDMVSERNYSKTPRFSEITTPVKGETDWEGSVRNTPRSRKSAQDCRRVLSETFQFLQKNLKNMIKNENSASSSSSSSEGDDDNSEDEKFEKTLEIEATTREERREKARIEKQKTPEKKDFSRMNPSELRNFIRSEAKKRKIESRNSTSSSESSSEDVDGMEVEMEKKKLEKSDFSKMKPSEIREFIKLEAMKRGVESRNLNSSTSSEEEDSEDSEDDSESNEKNENRKNRSWDSMTLNDIKKKIREAANEKNIRLRSSDSSDDADD